jgi:hypothetical protein
MGSVGEDGSGQGLATKFGEWSLLIVDLGR